MKKEINGVELEIKHGDIASQDDIAAVVNAANAQLRTGGGVAGALHSAAGPGLAREARPMDPISPGEAVITGGHNLPNDYVIHTLGPVYGRDKPEEELLAKCYRNSLQLAEEKDIESVAFPAISTGAFGYPIKEATEIALEEIIELTAEISSVKKIRFVLYSQGDLEVYQKILNGLLPD